MTESKASAAEELVEERHSETIMDGLRAWRNPRNGFFVADLEYIADPKKRDPAWLVSTRAGMPRAEFDREYGSRWVVYDGKPVYQDFSDIHIAHGSIIAPRRSRLISGWDGGPHDVHLAWALGLVYPDENAIIFLDEWYQDDGDTRGFVDIVRSKLSLDWYKLAGGFSLHVADQQVFTPSGVADGKAMADIMRLSGMAPIPGAVSFAERRISVETLIKGIYKVIGDRVIPAFQIHERCPLIIEALGGGYVYPKVNSGIGGEYKPLPAKNRFSHIANAVEYACSRIEIAREPIPFEGRHLPQRIGNFE